MKLNIHHEYVAIGSQKSENRIILLHGWGADYHDLLPLGEEIIKDLGLDFQIISLRAPLTNHENNGKEWYSLFPANWAQAKEEVDKLTISLKTLGKSNIKLSKTVLLGFSQGAAMAIAAGSELDLGLIVSCSGYPHPNWNYRVQCPILLSHGLKDNIVPSAASRDMFERIKSNKNSKSQLHEFNGFHEIDSNFIKVIRNNIKQIF